MDRKLVLSAAAAVLTAIGSSGRFAAGGELKFKHHFIDRDLEGNQYGQTALVDVDGDGDLDFITGRRSPRAEVFWYEHEAPERWKRRLLGSDHPSDVGGAALDIDGDGKVDHASGGVWYRNPGDPRERPFERHVFDKGLAAVHDVVLADIDGDRRPDVITMSDRNNLRWYRIAADPLQAWERRDIGPSVHAGAAAGDIDGDGDLDVARSNAWFENLDGKGTRWVPHENIPFGIPTGRFPLSTRGAVRDIDGDGDRDLVLTLNEIAGAKAAWMENIDGRGREWKPRPLPPSDDASRGAYHSLAVEDFDGDGDLDVFTCEMEWVRGERTPRWFIWENLDGRGGEFVERVILDAGLGGHEAVAADVDGDGDIDIASKLWMPWKENANGGRNHADYLENLRIVKRKE